MDSLRPENTHKTKFREWNYTKINYCASNSREAQKIKTRYELEREYLDKKYEAEKQRITTETSNTIDKEKTINIAKELLYSNLWINSDQNKNSPTTNFLKWMIDWLVIWNIDLAIEVYNTNGKILLDAFKSLMSLEWIKQMAEVLWENIRDFFVWNAYERWKSSVELILVWTWLAGTFKLTKFLIKSAPKVAIKAGEVWWKIIANWAETLKNLKWMTLSDIMKLWREQRLMAITKLWDKERLIVAWLFLKRELTDIQKRAVIEAHEVWSTRPWAWIGKYTTQELVVKWLKLRRSWLSPKETKILMAEWVCWGLATSQTQGFLDKVIWLVWNEKKATKPTVKVSERNSWIPNFEKNVVNLLEMEYNFSAPISIELARKNIEHFYKYMTKEYFMAWPEVSNKLLRTLDEMSDYIANNWSKIRLNKTIKDEITLYITGIIRRIDIIGSELVLTPIQAKKMQILAKTKLPKWYNAINPWK